MAETMTREAQAPAARADVAVVMVPLPAQGHLNQLLHLSRQLAPRPGISVHYFGSAAHNQQARDRSPGVDVERLIRFHDVPLSITSCPAPDHRALTKFPDHLLPAFDAALDLRTPLAELCRTLAAAARRVVIIYDFCMPLAAEVAASISGVEAYCFSPASAIFTLCFLWEQLGKPTAEAREELRVPYVSIMLSEAFMNFYLRQLQSKGGVISGCLLNTCRALETQFTQLLVQVPGWNKTFAVGPLNMTVASREQDLRRPRHECLRWLDEQPPASVVYVSFGSTIELADEQVAQLAAGLEDSGHRFVWVLKDADRADNYALPAADGDSGGKAQTQRDKLPPGFCQRNEGAGKVLRSWAPQQEILVHPSTAAFMSHCGWNSCMESFSAGVPILAWPTHSDQPMNALLATHVLGVGVPVFEWGTTAEEVVPAAAISGAIKTLMDSEEGRAVRRKARELGSEVRSAMEEGGSSTKDMDAFVALITR